MNEYNYDLDRPRRKGVSRRDVLVTGSMAGVAGGIVSALGLPLLAGRADAATPSKQNDVKIHCSRSLPGLHSLSYLPNSPKSHRLRDGGFLVGR